MEPLRTIEFLENTSKRIPWSDIKHSGVSVCYNPIDVEFYYEKVYPGGATIKITRQEASDMFTTNQLAKLNG